MLGFGETPEQKNFKADMAQRKDEADMNMAQQMFDPRKVAMDSQVSALLLEMESKFLKYRVDFEKNQLVPIETFNYVEPWGEEPRCFLGPEKERLVELLDMLLAEVYAYSNKYSEPMVNSFNEFVHVRFSKLNISRATGKAAKLAKSQFVESTAEIRRDLSNQQKKGGGLLGMGLGPL